MQPHGPVLCPQAERAVGWPASPWAPTLGSPPGHGVLGTAQVTGLRRHPADIHPRFLLASQASSPVLGSELTPTTRGLTGPQPTQPPFRVCAQPGPLATRGPRPRPVPSPFVPPLSGSAPPASPRATRGRTWPHTQNAGLLTHVSTRPPPWPRSWDGTISVNATGVRQAWLERTSSHDPPSASFT